MKPIKVFFDKVGNTLNVWFDDPQKEHVSEETSDEAKDVTVLSVESAVVS